MEAQAGDVYLGFRGGASLLQDSDMTIEIPGVGQIPAELEFDPGWLAGVAAGFEFDNGFAVEGEFTFRQNGIDQERLMGGIIPIDGFIRSYALMANGYYRLDTGTMFTPYVGAGAGGALLSIDADSVGGNFSDSDFAFAYQAMGGVAARHHAAGFRRPRVPLFRHRRAGIHRQCRRRHRDGRSRLQHAQYPGDADLSVSVDGPLSVGA